MMGPIVSFFFAASLTFAVAEIQDFTHIQFQVLLTGFRPFLNFTDNPTEALVSHLASTCENLVVAPNPGAPNRANMLRVCWHTHVLPVNRSGAKWTVEHLQSWGARSARIPYHAVFHTGFEDDAKGVKLEVIASNIHAKDSGSPGTQPAVPGAPKLQATTVNTGWMTLESIAAGVPTGPLSGEKELWSRDAGSYYCNEVYYRTLEFIRSESISVASGALLPAMFVHVPPIKNSSVQGIAEVLRRVAGHALWATYLAPGLMPLPVASSTLASNSPVPAAAAVTALVVLALVLGAIIGALFSLAGPATMLTCSSAGCPRRQLSQLAAPLDPFGVSRLDA